MNKNNYLGIAAIFVGILLAVAAFALYPTTTSGEPEAIVESLAPSAPNPGTNVSPVTTATLPGPEVTPQPIWQEAITKSAARPSIEQPRPVGLRIDRLGINAPIEPYGINTRSGQMEVPRNVKDVAWYKHGPSPGSSGSAVLAAHVDLRSQGPGVFFDLKEVEPGDVIYVNLEGGREIEFVVQARTTYAKDDLPTSAIFSKEGPAVLTLITCGGGFSDSAQSYDSNVVVYAVPADDAVDNPFIR